MSRGHAPRTPPTAPVSRGAQVLTIVGGISEGHGEALIRSAFQCLQLVVADFLPIMPRACLQLCTETAAKFGSQNQELNVSLTAVGLLVSPPLLLLLGSPVKGFACAQGSDLVDGTLLKGH